MKLPQTVNPNELSDEDAPPLPEGETTMVEVSAEVSPPIEDDDEMTLITYADTPKYAAIRLRMNAESIGREIQSQITVDRFDPEERPE